MLHANIVRVRDENGFGEIYNELQLSFENIEVTVKDIIVERVRLEVQKYSRKEEVYRHALVVPKEEEMKLNGKKIKNRKKLDVENQIAVAINAFMTNGFFMLIDDIQAEELDQKVIIKNDTSISFIRLIALVGG